MSASMPHVSVVIISLVDDEALERTRLSVKAQQYPDLDYVIVERTEKDGFFAAVDAGCENVRALHQSAAHWINILLAGECYVDNQVIGRMLSLPCASQPEVRVIGGGTIAEKAKSVEVIPNELPFSLGCCLIRADACRFDLEYQFAADYALLYHLYYNEGAGSVASTQETVLVEAQTSPELQRYSRYVRGEQLGIQSEHFSLRWLKAYFTWKFKWF